MILEVAVSKGVLHTHDDLRHVRYIPTMHFFPLLRGSLVFLKCRVAFRPPHFLLTPRPQYKN